MLAKINLCFLNSRFRIDEPRAARQRLVEQSASARWTVCADTVLQSG